MEKLVYTLHAEDKLTWPEIRKLGIRKKHLENVLKQPITIDDSDQPVYIAIGTFRKTLSLCVAYRNVKDAIRVITFWPAEKGRYERKVL